MTADLPSCEHVRAHLSAAFDGEMPTADGLLGEPLDAAAVDAHLDGCTDCRAFEQTMTATRSALRFESVAEAPDVRSRVAEQVARDRAHTDTAPPGDPAEPQRRSARPLRTAAVAAAIGLVIGAVVARSSLDGDAPRVAEAADLAEQAVVVQRDVEALALDFTLVERGWDRRVPERRYLGALRYQAPDGLSYELEDETVYPSDAWTANDVRLVLGSDRRYLRSIRGCTTATRAETATTGPCRSAIVDEQLVSELEPFDETTVVPLDLVTPVATLGAATGPSPIGRRMVAGRSAVGVELPAAEAADLLAGLDPGRTLRPVHPADEVGIWLDEVTLAPLEVTVTAAPGDLRAAWSRGKGLDDEPGDRILELRATRAVVDEPVQVDRPPPSARSERSAGFTVADGAPAGNDPVPSRLPAGLRPRTTGRVGDVDVRSWSDGRAWLTVRSTSAWEGTGPFGLRGAFRPVAVGDGAVLYVDGDGSHVALHGVGVDAVVAGSFPTERLVAVARSLDVEAVPLADAPSAADAASVDVARQVVPWLLAPSGGEVSIRVGGESVTVVAPDAGGHTIRLAQTEGDRLPPPVDTDDATAISVRGRPGRYSVARSSLEWVEDGVVVSLDIPGRPPDALLSVAESLVTP